MKKLLFLSILTVLFSCSDPDQVIYEGDHGFIIYNKKNKGNDEKVFVKLKDNSSKGDYVYYAKDVSGTIVVWSNQNFNIGDTLFLSNKR